MIVDQIDQMAPDQMREALHRVAGLCNNYTPDPPPFFRDPTSELGVGFNHGASTLAQAVLTALAGESAEDPECCEPDDCPTEPAPSVVLIWSHHHKLWFGPNGCGYRRNIADAGRYDPSDTTKWLGRGCYCCLVPEVVIPAPPPGLSGDAADQWGWQQVNQATLAQVESGQINRHANPQPDPRIESDADVLCAGCGETIPDPDDPDRNPGVTALPGGGRLCAECSAFPTERS